MITKNKNSITKYTTLFLILIGSFHAYAKKVIPSAPILQSPFVKFIDGIPGGLNGPNVGTMIHIRTKLRNMRYGTPDKTTKKRVGHYGIEDVHHSIYQLADMEQRYLHIFHEEQEVLDEKYLNENHAAFVEEYNDKKDALKKELEKTLKEKKDAINKQYKHENEKERALKIKKAIRIETRKYKQQRKKEKMRIKKNHIAHYEKYAAELARITQEYKQNIQPMKNIIEQAKEDIISIAEPFMERVRGTKEVMVHIIEEWAECTNQHNSPLLKWLEQKTGTEMDMFRKDVQSFHELDIFCADMISFLETMINTCQKGFAQYVKLVKKK